MKGLLQSGGTQLVGIECGKIASGGRVLRKKAETAEIKEQLVATADSAVAASALPADRRAVGSEGLSAFGIATVRENPRSHAADSSGFSLGVEIDYRPSDRVGAEIET